GRATRGTPRPRRAAPARRPGRAAVAGPRAAAAAPTASRIGAQAVPAVRAHAPPPTGAKGGPGRRSRQISLEQVRGGARVLVGAAARPLRLLGGEPLVVQLYRHVQTSGKPARPLAGAERLRPLLAGERQRQPYHDELHVAFSH